MEIAMKNRKTFCILLPVFFFLFAYRQTAGAQSYGLAFASHEVIPEQRTSLDLTEASPVCFTKHMQLSFELGFLPDYTTYFGYVFRLVNEANQNIDLLYDQKQKIFRLVNQEAFTDINFEIPTGQLMGGWTKLAFTVDAANGISCSVNGKTLQTKTAGLKNKCFKVLFGVSNEHDFVSRDVPPMRLKNVAIATDGEQYYFWSLSESSGLTTADSIHHKNAKVVNPLWIQPKHSNWKLIKSFTVKETPSLAFNNKEGELYVISADSLFTVSPQDSKLLAAPLLSPSINLLPGNQSIYDQRSGKLYNFYVDQKKVADYDFARKVWNRNFDSGLLTEYWQANKFISGDNMLYTLCGYGQLTYKNTVYKVNPSTNEWTRIQPAGDFMAPRYLSAAGTTASGDTAYVLGGFGSREGDQLLSPRYFYDLLRYDVRSNRLKKIYSLSEPKEQFVFANSLVLDPDNQSYYALIFPNNSFNTHLQLIKGSLTSPAYKLLGEPFPYSFSDVKSFADLFYCGKSNQLIAATLYSTNNRRTTEVKVYSIDFPPNEKNAGINEAELGGKRSTAFLLYILPCCLLLLAGFFFYFLKKRKSKSSRAIQPAGIQAGSDTVISEPAIEHPSENAILEPEPGVTVVATNTQPPEITTSKDMGAPENEENDLKPLSRIILFGNFEVLTAEGSNITKQFTPLLKEMFLLILITSVRYQRGVSAEKLTEVLWNDKDLKDAKNNRSVNLVKLKNVLDKLSGCTISRETGAWRFDYDPASIYIDLAAYLNLLKNDQWERSHKAKGLRQIVKQGGFLQEIHYEWLDGIKAEVSNDIIEFFLKYAERLNVHTENEEILKACEVIFSFDELNERALVLKCKSLIALGRHTLAKNIFTKFTVKYKEIYGEDYSQPFNTLVV